MATSDGKPAPSDEYLFYHTRVHSGPISVSMVAHGSKPVLLYEECWKVLEGAPAFDSSDHFANHSSGLQVLRLRLPGPFNQADVSVSCQDQGWGESGSAGAVVALLDETERHVVAYSTHALTSHGIQTMSWTIQCDKDGAHFPGKENEMIMGNICTQSREGMVLVLKVFTPNWGGW